MFTGPPLPLPPEFPLRQLIALVTDTQHSGVWVRNSGACHRLTILAQGRCIGVMIGEDLGSLVRCCSRVVLRAGSSPVAISVDALLQWRALQVATSMPHLPGAELLHEIFPQAELGPAGFTVPIRSHSPEEVLSECLRRGIPVMESRVVYKP